MTRRALTASLVILTIFGAYAAAVSADAKETPEHAVITGVEPAESRRERLERNKRIWESLPPEKKMELRRRFERWKNLPEPEKKKLRQNMARFQKMRQEQRAILERRFRQLQKMTPEQRMILHRRLEMWQRIRPPRREKVRMFLRVLKRLPPEKIDELRKMPPPQRTEAIEQLIRKIRQNMAPGQKPPPRPGPPHRMGVSPPGK